MLLLVSTIYTTPLALGFEPFEVCVCVTTTVPHDAATASSREQSLVASCRRRTAPFDS